MSLVASTATVTWLARANRLDVLETLPDELLIAEPTYEGLIAVAPERPGASALARFGEADSFRVVPVSDAPLYERLRGNERVADGDAAAVALASLVDGVLVAEAPYLGEIAVAETVPTTTLPGLLLRAVDGDLPPPRALDALDDLLAAGWHGRPDVYAAFIGALDTRR